MHLKYTVKDETMKRSSGILMPISSLPSPYGIGTLGKAAYEFVDFLAEARQLYWQILPVGPTSYGDSPYQSPSAYAGNPYFVDPEMLIADGLLTRGEVEAFDWGSDAEHVDYGRIYESRFNMLKLAADRGWERDRGEVSRFEQENTGWLYDYALFMAVKRHFDMKCWLDWPDEDIRMRSPEALRRYGEELQGDIQLFIYIQFLFFKQWSQLRAYAHEKGIRIIGDMALYVALDSADVWASPEYFQLDECNYPVNVAGVPPDDFTDDGQLWGNPLYDYERMAADGYGWWIRRVGGASKLYDVIRIDHFRGLESYWVVPAGETTAKNGKWVKGPGMDLVGRLTNWFKDTEFIAEDLGYPTPEVQQLLDDSGLPGMRVLEFAFYGPDSKEIPYRHPRNSICYVGTHDNETALGWLGSQDEKVISYAKAYLGLNEEEGLVRGLIRGGMSSVANLFISQMQDWLELDNTARMNAPGTLPGNWQWRMLPGSLTVKLASEIAAMTLRYGRSTPLPPSRRKLQRPCRARDE